MAQFFNDSDRKAEKPHKLGANLSLSLLFSLEEDYTQTKRCHGHMVAHVRSLGVISFRDPRLTRDLMLEVWWIVKDKLEVWSLMRSFLPLQQLSSSIQRVPWSVYMYSVGVWTSDLNTRLEKQKGSGFEPWHSTLGRAFYLYCFSPPMLMSL